MIKLESHKTAHIFSLITIGSLCALIYSFSQPLLSLIQSWQSEEYSHGYLIPLLAILIGWHRLVEARAVPHPSWTGVTTLFVAFFLLTISQLSAFEPPAHYGFVVALFGLSLTHFGVKPTKALAPALIYLLFAIPLPRLIYVELSARLQLFSSTLGVLPLQFLGYSVFQDGNVIDLGGYKLQVVEACNGLRYLFPLMSFGFLVALMLKDKMWKRIAIFLSTIPITLAMNALRISVIGITVNLWGADMAQGILHDFEGWAVFLFCIAILFGEVVVLMRIGPHGHFRLEYLGMAHGPLLSHWPKPSKCMLAGSGLCLLFAILAGTNLITSRAETTPSHPALALFPTTLGPWHGKQDSLSQEMIEGLRFDDYWLADYSAEATAPAINLYLAYYKSQRVGASIHSPANCIPGGGWQIGSRSIITAPMGSSALDITRMLVKKGEDTLLVYYWFDERGRVINEQYGAKWYLLIDSITMHRTDGALVRLTTPVSKGENEEKAEARLLDFLSFAYPEIKKHIPQN